MVFLGTILLILFGLALLAVFAIKLSIKIFLYIGPLLIALHLNSLSQYMAATFWMTIQLAIWIYFIEKNNNPPLA